MDELQWALILLLKKGYETNIKPSNTYNTFEHMIVSIVSANLCTITLVVLYRPQIPACTFPHATTPNDFLTEFDSLLKVVSLENNIVIVGDFNYDWVGQKHHSTKQKLQSILKSLDLTQQVCPHTSVDPRWIM